MSNKMKINPLLKISPLQLDIVNNYELRYKEFGSENEPIMVMVHGYADDYYVYNNLINEYQENYHIYAVQLPSVSNDTVVDKKQLDPLVYAYHVTKFLVDKDMKDIILFGHSMGGGIACFVNNLAPAGVIKTSILIDPMNSSNGVNLSNILKLNPKNLEGLIKILPLIYEKPYSVFGLDLLEHQLLVDAGQRYGKTHKNNKILFNRMASLSNKMNLKKAKDNNPIPSLVIFGKNDRLLLWKNAQRSYLSGKNFKFELVDDAGHVPFGDQPEICLGIITRWINKHASKQDN